MLQLNELEELRLDSHKSSRVYKENMNRWHNKSILRREFKEGDFVLLFNSHLKLFLGKLHSRWSRPFKFLQVFPDGVVDA